MVICGPTASGKTALALRLAGDKPTSIISADSRQIYQGLDTLTGKDIPPGFKMAKLEISQPMADPPLAENFKYPISNVFYADGQIRLFGFDLIRPDQIMNAAQYSDYARAVIDQEQKQNRQVIIVGGTGFYLQAVTDPSFLSHVEPDQKLRSRLDSLNLEDLQQQLWEIDPQKFMTLNDSDIKNPRRLIRAIEIALAVGAHHDAPSFERTLHFDWLGLRLPLEQIKERISLRVDVRLDEAIHEVRSLQKDYPDQSLPIYTSIGVKQLVQCLSGQIPRQEARNLWISQEVNYAKRQITWFKKQPQIIWYDQDSQANIKLT